MNETITNEALDLIVFADDCKCTARHDFEVPQCSGDITHFRRACEISGVICSTIAKWYSKMTAFSVCAVCGREAEDCWKVIPV